MATVPIRCASLPHARPSACGLPPAGVRVREGVPLAGIQLICSDARSFQRRTQSVKIDNTSDPLATIVTIEFGDVLGELLDTVRASGARGLLTWALADARRPLGGCCC
jgi:hypothetical protein